MFLWLAHFPEIVSYGVFNLQATHTHYTHSTVIGQFFGETKEKHSLGVVMTDFFTKRTVLEGKPTFIFAVDASHWGNKIH